MIPNLVVLYWVGVRDKQKMCVCISTISPNKNSDKKCTDSIFFPTSLSLKMKES